MVIEYSIVQVLASCYISSGNLNRTSRCGDCTDVVCEREGGGAHYVGLTK